MIRLKEILFAGGLVTFLLVIAGGISYAGGNADNGAKLYAQNCVPCHGDKGQGRGGPMGWFSGGGGEVSNLVGNQLNNQTFLSIASDDFLKQTINNGRPGRLMPPWKGKLKDSEIEDVIAFLRKWQTGPAMALSPDPVWGDPAAGGELFAAVCVQCHGKKGEGTEFGPALNNQSLLSAASDDFILQTLRKGRSGTIMRSFLQGNNDAMVELEPYQLNNIVAYIRTWDKNAASRLEPWLMEHRPKGKK
ncbi:MAG: hypothetical protein A2073_08460 [Deltaproteobacteria bacterium GWC2_42_11]|nr:MAG: hypothetical protein A2073_08460 [Deltaproteobacteria bacterium GWC2_42_11]HBO84151.1 hypothetical protein [Deltaproteobacteria bacterium]